MPKAPKAPAVPTIILSLGLAAFVAVELGVGFDIIVGLGCGEDACGISLSCGDCRARDLDVREVDDREVDARGVNALERNVFWEAGNVLVRGRLVVVGIE